MNNILLIPFRFDSNRLPGKAMRLIDGKPMIRYVIDGAIRANKVNYVGLISSNNENDKKIINGFLDILTYSWNGGYNDVLGRFLAAIKHFEDELNIKFDNVIRLTADCPLLNFFPGLIDLVIADHERNNADFTYNTHFNNSYPSGLDVEVVKCDVLWKIYDFANYEEREHVTLCIKNNPKKYNINYYRSLQKFNEKLSVDTEDDFKRVSDIISLLNLSKRSLR